MKRLFSIGSGLFIYSIIPVLSWIILSFVLGDDRIANVFSICYAFQFVWIIFRCFFGSGANIRKEKEHDKNAVWNSILWGTIFSIIIFSLPIIFIDEYIIFFGQNIDFYKIYVIYGIAQLFEQTLVQFIIEKLYFEDKEKLANIHLFSFNIINFLIVILLCACIPNTFVALLITLGIMLVYVVCLYIWQFEKFKIDFKFFKNLRYESSNIINALFMFVVYTFGYRNAFQAGEEYLLALNLVALCTDTQWDMLTARDTVAKVDIAKNRYNYKKEMRNAYFYTIILALSSVIMTFILVAFIDVSIPIVVVYLLFQVLDMMLDTYAVILGIYTQIEYSPALNTTLNIFTMVLWTILSVSVMSPYCTDIGRISQSIVLFVAFILIRFIKYKIVDGKLIVKNKNNKSQNSENREISED